MASSMIKSAFVALCFAIMVMVASAGHSTGHHHEAPAPAPIPPSSASDVVPSVLVGVVAGMVAAAFAL